MLKAKQNLSRGRLGVKTPGVNHDNRVRYIPDIFGCRIIRTQGHSGDDLREKDFDLSAALKSAQMKNNTVV